MKSHLLIIHTFSTLFFFASTAHAQQKDKDRWESQAKKVEIIRDDFGVPHIYGPTDADVVLGLGKTRRAGRGEGIVF